MISESLIYASQDYLSAYRIIPKNMRTTCGQVLPVAVVNQLLLDHWRTVIIPSVAVPLKPIFV